MRGPIKGIKLLLSKEHNTLSLYRELLSYVVKFSENAVGFPPNMLK